MTRGRLCTAVLVVAGVVVGVPTAAVAAAGIDDVSSASAVGANGDVTSSAAGLDQLEFQGVVQFRWVDRFGVHSARLPVQGADGVVRVGGPNGPQGVEWPVDVGPLPSLSGKYHTTSGDGPVVAGRLTTVVQIWSGGAPSETMTLDRDTGLVLARSELDAGGSVVRSMEFQELSLRLPQVPSHASKHVVQPAGTVAPSRLPVEYATPVRLAVGYQRLRAARVSTGVRVLYSDGIHGLSIFEQPGRLSTAGARPSSEPVRIAGGTGRSYEWAGGDVITWQAGPTVFTAVGDGPSTDVVAAARSMPKPHHEGLWGRLESLSRDVVDTLSGSR